MLKKLAFATCMAAILLTAACSPKESSAQTWTPEQLQTQGLAQLKARAHGFEVGNPVAAKTVYVFFDPQCPHCGELWEAARPLLGQVRMVWVPVGVLAPVSAPQGAVLLASDNPLQTMQAHENSIRARTGGIHPGSAQTADLEKVKANTRLFAETGFDGVPVMLYPDETGATKAVVGGMPTERLASALGLRR